jgi:HKD family nuclease
VPHLVDGGLSILQYVDNMVLFMEHDLEKARNLKFILSTFKQLSGLKVIFPEVSCFASMRANERLTFMPRFSVVG